MQFRTGIGTYRRGEKKRVMKKGNSRARHDDTSALLGLPVTIPSIPHVIRLKQFADMRELAVRVCFVGYRHAVRCTCMNIREQYPVVTRLAA